jgi:outer membrane protein assembly factor BamB
MKNVLTACSVLLLMASSASAQDRKNLYSTPTPPSREVLERLNMRMAWQIHLPMDGRRDGFISVQMNNGQVIALTRSGIVSAIDAETGRVLWKVLAGKPYDSKYAPTFNSRSVFVVNGVRLLAFDRANGGFLWEYRLPIGISAAPVADEAKIYLSGLTGVVAAYQLPSSSEIDSIRPREENRRLDDPNDPDYIGDRRTTSSREILPTTSWSIGLALHLDYTPLLSGDVLFYASPNGTLAAMPRTPIGEQQVERYRIQLDRNLTAPLGVYDDMAYVATSDTYLSAYNIPTGRAQWHFPAGGIITRTPFTTETDLYLSVDKRGLVRLDRRTGVPVWKIPQGRTTTNAVALVDRVLAVNNKFVYATDTGGRLIVLDREQGTQLSFYEPFRDYAFPVDNQITDRLMLAANDGSILCLHDREYEKPLQHRKYELGTSSGAGGLRTLEAKLMRKVNEKGADAMPLTEALKGFRLRYGVEFQVDDKAFRDAGLGSISNRPVVQLRVENQEVRDILKAVLDQVGATYKLNPDAVMVIPAQKAVAVAEPNPMQPMPMPMPMPMDPVEKAVRDALTQKVMTTPLNKLALGEMLTFFADRLRIKFEVDEKAFKEAGVDNVLAKEVQAKGENIAFTTVLRDILSQVGGDYEIKGDAVIIKPAKK